MDKNYTIKVKIEYEMTVSDMSKRRAIQQVKDIFAQEHNLELKDNEIIEVKLGNGGSIYEKG